VISCEDASAALAELLAGSGLPQPSEYRALAVHTWWCQGCHRKLETLRLYAATTEEPEQEGYYRYDPHLPPEDWTFVPRRD
jgi:hypothetical protein